jgi:hypothetical protein
MGLRWWRGTNYRLSPDNRHIECSGPFERTERALDDIDWAEVLAWSRGCVGPRWDWDGAAPPAFDVPKTTVLNSMLDWCSRFGCPGTLLFQTELLALPVSPAVTDDDPPAPAGLEQTVYHRVGARWITQTEACLDDDRPDIPHDQTADGEAPGPEDAGGTAPAEATPDVVSWSRGFVQLAERWRPLTVVNGIVTPVTMLPAEAFAHMVNGDLADCPNPESPDFWAVYREPTVELLRVSWYLREWTARIASPVTESENERWRLFPHTGFYPNDDGLPEWRVASFFHAYTLQPDFAPRICSWCKLPYFSANARKEYCREKCRMNSSKRRLRAKTKDHCDSSAPSAKRIRRTKHT